MFENNWGRNHDNKKEVRGYVVVMTAKALKIVWKSDDRYTSIVNFADRPGVPYDVFEELLLCQKLIV